MINITSPILITSVSNQRLLVPKHVIIYQLRDILTTIFDLKQLPSTNTKYQILSTAVIIGQRDDQNAILSKDDTSQVAIDWSIYINILDDYNLNCKDFSSMLELFKSI